MFREAITSVRSQPTSSVLTILMVAAMILTVLLTTGRTVGAEQQVLSSIDSAGTRAIVIRAEESAGLTTDALERIATLEGIEWVGAFSGSVDGTNTLIPDGVRVPVRFAYGEDLERMGIPVHPLADDLVYASTRSFEALGLPGSAGSITLTSGETFGVGGRLRIPDFLRDLEPVAIVPRLAPSGAENVNLIILLSPSPELVTPISEAAMSVLGARDPSKVTLSTSETLVQLRSLIQGQLGTFSRGLVLALLALTGILLAALLCGLVVMRRKDFGRRRALGASRSYIIGLLILQTIYLAGIGVVVGTSTGVVLLIAAGDPWPGAAFTVALAVLALVTAVIATIAPAILASRRDPVVELRVP